MKVIEANIPFASPPQWALLERRLMDLMDTAYIPLMERYVRADGSLLWPVDDNHEGIDALDDAYESFHNWPLYYVLGGDAIYLELSLHEFEAITKQFEQYPSGHGHAMVVNEYEQGYDWFHQGEGYLFFYLLNLAAPENIVNQERSIRFAGFYLNEDPLALNYDEPLKLVKCAHSGSMGPAYRNFTGEPWVYEDWKAFYGLPFADITGCSTIEDVKRLEIAAAVGEKMSERMSRGDVPSNLAITSMMTNAYLHTGAEKYKNWVKEYVTAWQERTANNHGILPDNVGLSGEIGEYTEGKWYGGYYGWTWPHGWLSIGDAVVIAAQNAMLLLQDTAYLDLPRSQMLLLKEKGIYKEGSLHVPYKYGDPGCYCYKLWIEDVLLEDNGDVLWQDGWFEFQPMDARLPVQLWNMSSLSEDRQLVHSLRNYKRRDWEQVRSKPAKDQGGHDAAWLAYLDGDYPDYPVEIMNYNLSQVHNRLKFMEEDQQDSATYTDSYLQARNPITVEGLTQLTVGAPLPVYNGGLLMARVRYYDLERQRPGLPLDVAALVESMDADSLSLQLVNLHTTEERICVVQAGGYGEHQFISAAYQSLVEGSLQDNDVDIDDKHLEVHLKAGSWIRLRIKMHRFINEPTYYFKKI